MCIHHNELVLSPAAPGKYSKNYFMDKLIGIKENID